MMIESEVSKIQLRNDHQRLYADGADPRGHSCVLLGVLRIVRPRGRLRAQVLLVSDHWGWPHAAHNQNSDNQNNDGLATACIIANYVARFRIPSFVTS